MEALKQNFSYSTIRTIISIGLSSKLWAKIAWMLAFLTCLTIFITFAVQSVMFFFRYPIGTTTRLDYAPLEFPAVSACNLNPYKVSALKEKAPQIYRAIQQYSAEIIAKNNRTRKKRETEANDIKSEDQQSLVHLPQTHEELSDFFVARRRRRGISPQAVPDNIGKTFYMTFSSYKTSPLPTQTIMLATYQPTPFNVTITTRDNSFTKIQRVDNKQVYSVPVTSAAGVGIKLVGAYDFMVYGMVKWSFTADGFLVLPTDVLGVDYILMGVEDSDNQNNINIIGTQNGTSITVYYAGGTTNTFLANETDVITLRRQPDLTGTRITSTKPVAVITANDCANIPRGCCCCDFMVEQITPTNTWGMAFPLAPFVGACLSSPTCCANGTNCVTCYEFFKVVAYTDGTTVRRVGSSTSETFTLNAREWRNVMTKQTEYSYLTSNKPLQVAQIMSGDEYKDPSGDSRVPTDPSLLMIPPTDGFTNIYHIISCNNAFTDHYVSIVIEQSSATGLLLNNQTFLGATTPYAIPNTTLSAYQYKLPCSGTAKSFAISHDDISVLFSVAAYGFGTFISYAYMAGVRLGNGSYFCQPTADANPPDNVDNDCDGWVDEELRNFVDDDGDGKIDEDLAAAIPIATVLDSQITSCNLSSAPLPVNNSEPDLPEAMVDPRCTPYRLNYSDNVTTTNNCSAVISRIWQLRDDCGNIANNVTQLITIALPIDNYTAPPAAYLNTTADLSNPNATGVPRAISSCQAPAPFSWTFSDAIVNETYVNRTWVVQPTCGNSSVTLLQDIYIKFFTTTVSTTTATTSTVTTTTFGTTTTTSSTSTSATTTASTSTASTPTTTTAATSSSTTSAIVPTSSDTTSKASTSSALSTTSSATTTVSTTPVTSTLATSTAETSTISTSPSISTSSASTSIATSSAATSTHSISSSSSTSTDTTPITSTVGTTSVSSSPIITFTTATSTDTSSASTSSTATTSIASTTEATTSASTTSTQSSSTATLTTSSIQSTSPISSASTSVPTSTDIISTSTSASVSSSSTGATTSASSGSTSTASTSDTSTATSSGLVTTSKSTGVTTTSQTATSGRTTPSTTTLPTSSSDSTSTATTKSSTDSNTISTISTSQTPSSTGTIASTSTIFASSSGSTIISSSLRSTSSFSTSAGTNSASTSETSTTSPSTVTSASTKTSPVSTASTVHTTGIASSSADSISTSPSQPPSTLTSIGSTTKTSTIPYPSSTSISFPSSKISTPSTSGTTSTAAVTPYTSLITETTQSQTALLTTPPKITQSVSLPTSPSIVPSTSSKPTSSTSKQTPSATLTTVYPTVNTEGSSTISQVTSASLSTVPQSSSMLSMVSDVSSTLPVSSASPITSAPTVLASTAATVAGTAVPSTAATSGATSTAQMTVISSMPQEVTVPETLQTEAQTQIEPMSLPTSTVASIAKEPVSLSTAPPVQTPVIPPYTETFSESDTTAFLSGTMPASDSPAKPGQRRKPTPGSLNLQVHAGSIEATTISEAPTTQEGTTDQVETTLPHETLPESEPEPETDDPSTSLVPPAPAQTATQKLGTRRKHTPVAPFVLQIYAGSALQTTVAELVVGPIETVDAPQITSMQPHPSEVPIAATETEVRPTFSGATQKRGSNRKATPGISVNLQVHAGSIEATTASEEPTDQETTMDQIRQTTPYQEPLPESEPENDIQSTAPITAYPAPQETPKPVSKKKQTPAGPIVLQIYAGTAMQTTPAETMDVPTEPLDMLLTASQQQDTSGIPVGHVGAGMTENAASVTSAPTARADPKADSSQNETPKMEVEQQVHDGRTEPTTSRPIAAAAISTPTPPTASAPASPITPVPAPTPPTPLPAPATSLPAPAPDTPSAPAIPFPLDATPPSAPLSAPATPVPAPANSLPAPAIPLPSPTPVPPTPTRPTPLLTPAATPVPFATAPIPTTTPPISLTSPHFLPLSERDTTPEILAKVEIPAGPTVSPLPTKATAQSPSEPGTDLSSVSSTSANPPITAGPKGSWRKATSGAPNMPVNPGRVEPDVTFEPDPSIVTALTAQNAVPIEATVPESPSVSNSRRSTPRPGLLVSSPEIHATPESQSSMQPSSYDPSVPSQPIQPESETEKADEVPWQSRRPENRRKITTGSSVNLQVYAGTAMTVPEGSPIVDPAYKTSSRPDLMASLPTAPFGDDPDNPAPQKKVQTPNTTAPWRPQPQQYATPSIGSLPAFSELQISQKPQPEVENVPIEPLPNQTKTAPIRAPSDYSIPTTRAGTPLRSLGPQSQQKSSEPSSFDFERTATSDAFFGASPAAGVRHTLSQEVGLLNPSVQHPSMGLEPVFSSPATPHRRRLTPSADEVSWPSATALPKSNVDQSIAPSDRSDQMEPQSSDDSPEPSRRPILRRATSEQSLDNHIDQATLTPDRLGTERSDSLVPAVSRTAAVSPSASDLGPLGDRSPPYLTSGPATASQPDRDTASEPASGKPADKTVVDSRSEDPATVQGHDGPTPYIPRSSDGPTIDDSIMVLEISFQPSDGISDLAWSAQMQDILAYIMKSMDPDGTLAELLGYGLDEFIFWCRYDGRKCDLSGQIKMFLDPNFGNCFTFNWRPQSHFATRAGQRLGLRLIFNTPSNDYLPFSLSAGFALAFHQSNEDPMIQEVGVKGSPGMHYMFALSKLNAYKIGEPYDPCAISKTTANQNFYVNKSYTVETCLATCYQKMVLKQCKCGDPHYPIPPGSIYCNVSQKSCIEAASETSFSHLSPTSCGCQPACSVTSFNFVQTKAFWGTDNFTPPKCTEKEGLDLESCRKSFQGNYSRVDIYYNSMTGTSLEEYAEYTIWQLVSDIFANVGLWLGCCVVTIFEMIVFPAVAVFESLSQR